MFSWAHISEFTCDNGMNARRLAARAKCKEENKFCILGDARKSEKIPLIDTRHSVSYSFGADAF